MIRPCFLVVDREHPISISTRKLVLETAKFNVLTAYSGAEAIETLQAFPAVHGVVLDGLMKDMPCADLLQRLRALQPNLPVVVVGGQQCEGATQYIDLFDPQMLLEVLKGLVPQEAKAIEKHDAELLLNG